jgi:hypothetical protein
MSARNWSDQQLQAYLNDELSEADLSSLERDLRADSELRERLENLPSQDETHSVGEIWRRHRLSCPSREELRQKLEGKLPTEQSRYIDFHLETVGCEICTANYEDLRSQSEPAEDAQRRRQTIFESSAGFLNSRNKK